MGPKVRPSRQGHLPKGESSGQFSMVLQSSDYINMSEVGTGELLAALSSGSSESSEVSPAQSEIPMCREGELSGKSLVQQSGGSTSALVENPTAPVPCAKKRQSLEGCRYGKHLR